MGRFMKCWGVLLVLGMAMILAACGETETGGSQDGEKLHVVTTISQIGEPLSVIGGDKITVESLMGPSVDPHLYNPTQRDIQKLGDADIIFYSGLHLEANMVDMFASIGETKPVMAMGDAITEDELLTDENGAIDPHIWFDIDLWRKGLTAAVEQLKESSPENADFFEENKQAYFAELDALKQEAEKLSEIPKEHRFLVTAHDAFGYFGRLHDLEVIGLQGLSTESEVGVADINNTIAIIKEYNVPAIFVESSINQNTIQAVIEGAQSDGVDVSIGGELYSDAMGQPGTEEGTYIGMYRHNISTIYKALNQ